MWKTIKRLFKALWRVIKNLGYWLCKNWRIIVTATLVLALLLASASILILNWNSIAAFLRNTGGPKPATDIPNHIIIRNMVIGIAAFAGAILTWWRAKSLDRQATVAEQGLITDRFIKANEQLGSNELSIRLGAIYSLWRIAEDSTNQGDKKAVLDVLCAFVRSSIPKKRPERTDAIKNKVAHIPTQIIPGNIKITEDVQAAITLLATSLRKLKLHDVYLLYFFEANIPHAKLSGANLSRANLSRAYLWKADLSGAYLWKANLSGADLSGANILYAKNFTQDQLKSIAKLTRPILNIPDGLTIPDNLIAHPPQNE